LIGFWKPVGSLRNDLDREALEGILGSLRWHKNLWFILLASSTLPYVRLTLLHNQTRWATCFICVLLRITGIARVDGVIPSMDPIFASRYESWCRHVSHTCAFRMSIMGGKDTLHSNGGSPRLDVVHAAARRMDTVSISERYCMWTLSWRAGMKGSFSAGTITTFERSLSANRIAPTSYYKESRL
jgi:hypothetical protein